MDKQIRILRSVGLSVAVLLLLSCQFFSSLLDGQGDATISPTAAFTLVESRPTSADTTTWTPTFTAAERTQLPSPLSPTSTLTLSPEEMFSPTPTSLASFTPATTLTPAPTFTLGTPLPTNTPFPTATLFRTPTPTLSGPLIIDLNGFWEGVKRFDANCGKCDSTMAVRANWIIYHVESGLAVNVGLGGTMNGTVATLSGTENWIGGAGWMKLNYILTLQPDGDTLKGRFWGVARLPSPCINEIKLRSCDIANGTITMER